MHVVVSNLRILFKNYKLHKYIFCLQLKKYFNELWKHVLKLLNMLRNVVLDYREPTNTPTLIHKSGD